jgi:hypothetical protein
VLIRSTLAWLVLLLPVLLASPVHAADANANADAAQGSDAMERAKRQAASPLRVIMEAAKVRRKVVAATSTTTTTALAGGPRVDETPAAEEVRSVSTRALPSQPAPAASKESKPLDSPEPAPVAAAVPLMLPSLAPASTLMREAFPRPKLVEMIEPAVPQRVLDDLGRAVEINVDITIRTDGSVASVAVLQPAPRSLIRYVVAAIERWRFESLPSGLVHRVQLLFNER